MAGISAKKLVALFKKRINMLDSGANQDVALVDLICYLNEAQELWFETRVGDAEIDEKVRNDLRQLEIKKHCVPCEKVDDKCCRVPYPSNFYQRLNQYAKTCGIDCCSSAEKEIIIRINQSDDLNESFIDPYREASFEYEQLNGDEAGNYLYIYHQGKMEVKEVCMDYYRKPNEIHAPSLDTCNTGYKDYCGNLITEDQNFEIDATYAYNCVVDLAVAFYHRDMGNTSNYQTQIQYVLNKYKLKKLNNG